MTSQKRDPPDAPRSFQDAVSALTAAHTEEMGSAQKDFDLKLDKLVTENNLLRTQLREAGLTPQEVAIPVHKELKDSLERDGMNGVTMKGESDRPGNGFEVKGTWKRMLETNTWGQSLDAFMTSFKKRRADSSRYANALMERPDDADGCRTVIFPNSNFRLGWDLWGLLLICFDLFTIPFNQAFLPDPTIFSDFMDWVTLVFWTGDMMQGFFLGYYEKGQYVSSNKRILFHYLKTWFVIDVAVIGPEWLMLIATSLATDDGDQVNSIAKVLKGARAVRVLRLLRLLKLQRIINILYDMIESEWTFIILNLAKLLIFVLVLNHVIACVWYFIGRVTMEHGLKNWILTGSVNGTDLAYMYTTSLHWSLTQFTPASMDISARNTWERIFSIIVLFFALVTFSSIVASITGSTTSLRNMKTDEMKQFWLLRRYLRQRDVSNDLSNRIFKFLEHQLKSQSNLVKRGSISILVGLSEQLQNEMTHQMHSPHLILHPFFSAVDVNMKVVMYRLCRYVLKPQSFAEKESVFAWGDVAKKMFFIKTGLLQYTMMDGTKLDPAPQPKEWISEAVLWTDWRHQGDLTVETASELISVDPAQFVEVMSVHPRPWCFAKNYASHFVNFLNTIDRLDLMDILRDEFFYEAAVNESEGVDQSESMMPGTRSYNPLRVAAMSSKEKVLEPECPKVLKDLPEPPGAKASEGRESDDEPVRPRRPPLRVHRLLNLCPCSRDGASQMFS